MLALPVIALLAGAGAIVANYRSGGGRAFLVLKPLTTALILGSALLAGPKSDPGYQVLVSAGLLSALVGDVLLMLGERWFLGGMLSFSLTHLLYLAAFVASWGLALIRPTSAALALVAVLLAATIWGGVKRSLRLPVGFYVVLITVMAAQALGAALGSQTRAAVVAAVGALLFLLSDAVLAIDRFRSPFAAARGIVLSTYWLGQWLIAASVHP